jgi:hypothetical protein
MIDSGFALGAGEADPFRHCARYRTLSLEKGV